MTRPFCLGITGSIGMGKSTTAGFFREFGVPVWDADAAVHRIYAKDGGGAELLAPTFGAAVEDGAVSREKLKQILTQNPALFPKLEQIVHPLVEEDRRKFIAKSAADMVVLDIPLLFEKGLQRICDATLLITSPYELQRERVLARDGFSEETYKLILSRQIPDVQKRTMATHILETLDLPSAKAYVAALIAYIRRKQGQL